MHPSLAHQKGNTLVEYGLIGATIVMTMIGALMYVSSNIDFVFGGLGTDMTSKAAIAEAAKAKADAEIASRNAQNQSGGKTIQITLKDGTKITLDNYPSDYTGLVQTIGANGITNQLASTLDTLIDQLVAEGKLTPEQENALRNLSNAGHDIGAIQALLEGAASNASDNSAFNKTQLVFNGKNYTPYQLQAEIGYWVLAPSMQNSSAGMFVSYTPESLLDSGGSPYGHTEKLLDLHAQAKKSGALNDPAVAAVVQSLVDDIALSSEVTQNATWLTANQSEPINEFQNAQTSSFTHKNSAGICNEGGRKDSGVQCI